MREVEVSRFVRATRHEVSRALSPASLVEYEGSFTVRDVQKNDDGWLVTAGARGLEMELAFEEIGDGWAYEQRGDSGPFEAMRTTVTAVRENEGVHMTMRSTVSLGLPLPALSDRVAAWKRRGELKRALARLAADVE